MLLSQQHMVTLEHCIEDFSLWFGGFQHFSVRIGEATIGVARVQPQLDLDAEYPLVILTLESNLTWIPTPVCVGAFQHGLLAAAVGWGGEDNVLREEPITLYHRNQCMDFYPSFNPDKMLCGASGPMECGAPLLQADNGRWMLVGLGVGDTSNIARYVRLEPSLEWLENA